MIMIQMTGGLGNQMFQYALYCELRNRGYETVIDDFTKYDGTEERANCICRVFGVEYERGTKKEYNRLTDSSMLPWKRVKRKVFGRKQKLYQEKDALQYTDLVFKDNDKYLIGYFQSEKYFANVANSLKEQFRFPKELITKQAQEYLQQIRSTESVSIHVRRGDYVSDRFSSIYGNICTDEYYKSAMQYMREKLGTGCAFYIFTNDALWVKENYTDADCTVVECCDEETGYLDMMLMSCCKHNIIANSSFSWWAAWLNENTDKIVIAPSRWNNLSSAQDIYAATMKVRFNNKGEQVYG